MSRSYLNGKVKLHAGDCLDVLRTQSDASIDSVVTDPPYALVSITKRFGKDGAAPVKVPEGGTGAYARASAGFMGKAWDTGERAFAVEFWQEVYRVLKPGGHVLAFAGTRTYHRLVCAIEDAGFEIRDQIGWAYGSGFPKSHDVSKGIDKAAGVERAIISERANRSSFDPDQQGGGRFQRGTIQVSAAATDAARRWQGWGTALKPAWEPICVARKPIQGAVAENVLRHGTGALNINGCRVAAPDGVPKFTHRGEPAANCYGDGKNGSNRTGVMDAATGRWPANIVHDGSDEVVAAFPETTSGSGNKNVGNRGHDVFSGGALGAGSGDGIGGDSGSAARFFYSAKADQDDRLGSKHPTVKPVDLLQWMVRLVTPPGGTVLDCFAGTGTTGEAAYREGFKAVLIEREEEYLADIERRMSLVLAGPEERRRAITKQRGHLLPPDGMFAGLEAAE